MWMWFCQESHKARFFFPRCDDRWHVDILSIPPFQHGWYGVVVNLWGLANRSATCAPRGLARQEWKDCHVLAIKSPADQIWGTWLTPPHLTPPKKRCWKPGSGQVLKDIHDGWPGQHTTQLASEGSWSMGCFCIAKVCWPCCCTSSNRWKVSHFLCQSAQVPPWMWMFHCGSDWVVPHLLLHFQLFVWIHPSFWSESWWQKFGNF